MKLSSKDIHEALSKAGVCSGDTIFVHSFLGAFGPLEDKMDGALEGLRAAIGPTGTLIMPTYNYDFCKAVPYHHEQTASTVGQLTEYFRSRPSVIRHFHPVYSHAIEGPDSEFYTRNPSPSAFGEDSFFARLHQRNAKIVFFGVSMHYATFIHHVEESLKAPYRYIKNFSADVTVNNRTFGFTAQIYSRHLELNVQLEMKTFQSHLLESGLALKSVLGRGEIMCVSARDFFNEAVTCYQKNMFYFLKHPIDLTAIEHLQKVSQ